eukprot:394251_1
METVAVVVAKAAPSIATCALSMSRKWVKEKTDQAIQDIVSPNNASATNNNQGASFDEKCVAQKTSISNALTKQLDEIKEGINILRNKDFDSAKSYFIEALRWRHDQNKFEEYIKLSYHKGIESKSSIVT